MQNIKQKLIVEHPSSAEKTKNIALTCKFRIL